MKNATLFLMTLTLAGALVLSACAAPAATAASLSGTTWRLVSTASMGTQTPAVPNVPTKLAFAKDGTLAGNLGCNSIGGSYTVKGNQITFGQLSTTLMACPDPQMAQEANAFLVLKDTAGFKLDGSTLTITSADHGTTLTFVAAVGE